jgi:anti-sigma factor RsiW
MSDHLSPATLNALADGELTADQLASANGHLAGCPTCTSNALYLALLKTATTNAGKRYSAPPQLRERLTHAASQANAQMPKANSRAVPTSSSRSGGRFGSLGWAVAALLLLVSVSELFVLRTIQGPETATAEHATLVTEVFDQHVATLADNQPLQVISTDRHTVKPWFQGKLPFSFNLPQNLPSDTTLDGANLTYLHNQPVAQLLFSIGKHRVSVFLRQTHGETNAHEFTAERSGFHVMEFSTNDLNVLAVSDVDEGRLGELANLIRFAQTAVPPQAR